MSIVEKEKTPMAVYKYDVGRSCLAVGPFFTSELWLNFHVIQESAAVWSLPGIMSVEDAELHCGVPNLMILCHAWVGPFQSIKWALQQVHPHASMQSVLEPKFDAVAKLVASKNPGQLDEIRTDRLEFWTQRAIL